MPSAPKHINGSRRNHSEIDTSAVRLPRFIPLRAYLSESPAHVEDVSRAITSLVEAFGFEIADDFPAIHGSWFKSWFAKLGETATQPEVAARLVKVERALELKGLEAPQAEIDAKQAEAVAKLMSSIENVPNAALQVGSILLVKLTKGDGPVVQVRTLTQRELIQLENNQNLLTSPSTVLDRLAELCRPAFAPAIDLDGIGKNPKEISGDGVSSAGYQYPGTHIPGSVRPAITHLDPDKGANASE